jgi:hypothetical protein
MSWQSTDIELVVTAVQYARKNFINFDEVYEEESGDITCIVDQVKDY